MNAKLGKCANCGSSDVEDREVEKLVRGGKHVVALHVPATVCHHCGERYFDHDTVKTLESARTKLEKGELEEFRTVGQMVEPETGVSP